MATHSQRGQVMIELIICATLLGGFFLFALTVSETTRKTEERFRFEPVRTRGRE